MANVVWRAGVTQNKHFAHTKRRKLTEQEVFLFVAPAEWELLSVVCVCKAHMHAWVCLQHKQIASVSVWSCCWEELRSAENVGVGSLLFLFHRVLCFHTGTKDSMKTGTVWWQTHCFLAVVCLLLLCSVSALSISTTWPHCYCTNCHSFKWLHQYGGTEDCAETKQKKKGITDNVTSPMPWGYIHLKSELRVWDRGHKRSDGANNNRLTLFWGNKQ